LRQNSNPQLSKAAPFAALLFSVQRKCRDFWQRRKGFDFRAGKHASGVRRIPTRLYQELIWFGIAGPLFGFAIQKTGSASRIMVKLDEGALPVRFEEYGADSYRITPMQPLAAGEYAFGTPGFVTQFLCFGVDR
jgi:hypothetical protein